MILTDQLSPGQEGASVPVVPPASSGNTKRGGDVVTKPQSPATLHTTSVFTIKPIRHNAIKLFKHGMG